MANRNLTKAEKLLIEVAINPPIYAGFYVNEARIPWELVRIIRTHLAEAGIDWRKIKEEYEKIKLENKILVARQRQNSSA